MNIFVDKNTGVIGFNKHGVLYFNLLFFNKLHFKSNKVDIVDTYCYWFVVSTFNSFDLNFQVFSHELAHNFVDVHNADHSFISEQVRILLIFGEAYQT